MSTINCMECRGGNPDCVFCDGTGRIVIGGKQQDGLHWGEWIILGLGLLVCVAFWWSMYHLWKWL